MSPRMDDDDAPMDGSSDGNGVTGAAAEEKAGRCRREWPTPARRRGDPRVPEGGGDSIRSDAAWGRTNGDAHTMRNPASCRGRPTAWFVPGGACAGRRSPQTDPGNCPGRLFDEPISAWGQRVVLRKGRTNADNEPGGDAGRRTTTGTNEGGELSISYGRCLPSRLLS
jgi:hypothetical protein